MPYIKYIYRIEYILPLVCQIYLEVSESFYTTHYSRSVNKYFYHCFLLTVSDIHCFLIDVLCLGVVYSTYIAFYM